MWTSRRVFEKVEHAFLLAHREKIGRRTGQARSLVCKWRTQFEAAAAKAACWRSGRWAPTTATRRRPTTAAAAAVPCRLDLSERVGRYIVFASGRPDRWRWRRWEGRGLIVTAAAAAIVAVAAAAHTTTHLPRHTAVAVEVMSTPNVAVIIVVVAVSAVAVAVTVAVASTIAIKIFAAVVVASTIAILAAIVVASTIAIIAAIVAAAPAPAVVRTAISVAATSTVAFVVAAYLVVIEAPAFVWVCAHTMRW